MTAPRRLNDIQIEEMARLREKGWGCQRIADHFGERGIKISASAVYWQCLRVGADVPVRLRGQCVQPDRPYSRKSGVVRPFTPEEDALLRVLDLQGFTIAVIARRMQRRPNSIRGRLMILARRDARAEDLAA